MKKILFFYLDGCPYCQMAKKAVDEIYSENPEFKNFPVSRINEHEKETSGLKKILHYYVPAFYVDEAKIYEANPGDNYEKIKSEVRRVFEIASK